MKFATLIVLAIYAAFIGYVRWAIWRDARTRQREELEAEVRRWAEAARARRQRHEKGRARLRRLQQQGGHPAA